MPGPAILANASLMATLEVFCRLVTIMLSSEKEKSQRQKMATRSVLAAPGGPSTKQTLPPRSTSLAQAERKAGKLASVGRIRVATAFTPTGPATSAM